MDIAKYIGETTEYDKKQEVERRKVKSWLKSVSAFANGGGGCLLFGIADDDTIIGLTDAKTDAEFISQKIKERIDPIPQIDLKIERVEDKELLILHVHGGEDLAWQETHPDIEVNFVENEGDTQDVPQGDTQGDTQGVPQDVPQGVPQGDDLDKWIEYQVAVYPKITTEELALQIGVTSKTIKRRIAKMPHIVYVGSGYSGHWEVKPKKK